MNKLKFTIISIIGFIIVFIVPLNTIPSYAETMERIPVIGEICKIFTFKEYHFKDEIKYIDAKIPQFINEGNNPIEKKINKEISKTINKVIKESKAIAKEYYDAFIETGGNPKDFIPVGINVDYEIKCISDDYVSFVITKNQTFPSAYFMQYFYNINMKTGKNISLKDWLGEDYKKIATQSINKTISCWSQEQKDMLWKDLNIEELINEDTKFYINEHGQAVIVFEKYEIAVGTAGIIEFPIEFIGDRDFEHFLEQRDRN